VIIGAELHHHRCQRRIHLSGVATPYDLIILAPAPTKAATVYTQLTRTDPRVPDLAAGNPTPLTATVKGALSGGAPLPATPGTLTLVAWGSPDQAFGGDYVTSSPYSFDVLWVGPTTITGAVHGLQWTIDQNSTVTGYLAHGVKTGVSLSNAATVTDADLALTAPLTDNISVTATPPAGHEIFERDVSSPSTTEPSSR
jgi:hypothetical protein